MSGGTQPNYQEKGSRHSGPTWRAADAAGAAVNLGATFPRLFLPPACALTTAASSAADASVGRSTPIAFVRPVEWYTNPIRLCPTSRMLYESDSHLPPIRRMGESDS